MEAEIRSQLQQNVTDTKNGRRTNEGESGDASRRECFPSKYEGLGAAITAELMISFWFGGHLSCWGSGCLESLP